MSLLVIKDDIGIELSCLGFENIGMIRSSHEVVLKGTVSNNQNGNLRWFLPLSVEPPPPNGTNFQTFFYPIFFLLQFNPTYI